MAVEGGVAGEWREPAARGSRTLYFRRRSARCQMLWAGKCGRMFFSRKGPPRPDFGIFSLGPALSTDGGCLPSPPPPFIAPVLPHAPSSAHTGPIANGYMDLVSEPACLSEGSPSLSRLP